MLDNKNYRCLVYFAAPSSFLSKHKETLEKITTAIDQAGGKLTLKWFEDKNRLSPEGIFTQAIEGIRSADIVVAEISYPSTGVGQQIALALSWKIPVIALYKKDAEGPSRFTIGFQSELFSSLKYTDKDLLKLLEKEFTLVLKSRYVKFNFIATREINNFLEEKSGSAGISKSQYLRDILRFWIDKHEGRKEDK